MSIKPFRSIRRVGSTGVSGDVLTLGSHISSMTAHPIYVKKGDKVGTLNIGDHLADEAPHIDYVIQRKEFIQDWATFYARRNTPYAQYGDLNGNEPVGVVVGAPLLYTILKDRLLDIQPDILVKSNIDDSSQIGTASAKGKAVVSLLRFTNLKTVLDALVSGVYTTNTTLDNTYSRINTAVTQAQYNGNPFSRLFAYVNHNHDDRYALKSHTHFTLVSGTAARGSDDGGCTAGASPIGYKFGDQILCPSWQGHTHKVYADGLRELETRIESLENTGEDAFVRGLRTRGIYPSSANVRDADLTTDASDEEFDPNTSFGYDFNKIVRQGSQVLFIKKSDAEDSLGNDLTHLPSELIESIKNIHIADTSDVSYVRSYEADLHTTVAVKVTANREDYMEFGTEGLWQVLHPQATRNFVFRSIRQLVTSDPGVTNNPRAISSLGLGSDAVQNFWTGTHGIYWRAGMSLGAAWYIESVLHKCLGMTAEAFYETVSASSDPVSRIAELLYSAIDSFDPEKYPDVMVGYYVPDIRSSTSDGTTVTHTNYAKRALRPSLQAVAAGITVPRGTVESDYYKTVFGVQTGSTAYAQRGLVLTDATMWLQGMWKYDPTSAYDFYSSTTGKAAALEALFSDPTNLLTCFGYRHFLHSTSVSDTAGTVNGVSYPLWYPGYLRMHDISVTYGAVDPGTAIDQDKTYTIDGNAVSADSLRPNRPVHSGASSIWDAMSIVSGAATVSKVYAIINFDWAGAGTNCYCSCAFRKLKSGTTLKSGVTYYEVSNNGGSAWNSSTNKVVITANNVGTAKFTFTAVTGKTVADGNTWTIMFDTDNDGNTVFRRKIVNSSTLTVAANKYYYFGMNADGNSRFIDITSAEISSINSTSAAAWLKSKFEDTSVAYKPISGYIYERLDIQTITEVVGLGTLVPKSRVFVQLLKNSNFTMPLVPTGVSYYKIKTGTHTTINGMHPRITSETGITWDPVDPAGTRPDQVYTPLDYYALTGASGTSRETPAFFFKTAETNFHQSGVYFKMAASFDDGTHVYRKFTQEYTYGYDKGDETASPANWGTIHNENDTSVDLPALYETVNIETLCNIYEAIKDLITAGAPVHAAIAGATPIKYNFTYDGSLIMWGQWDKIITEATAPYALSSDLTGFVKKSVFTSLMTRVSSLEAGKTGVDATGTVAGSVFRIHMKDFPNAEEIKSWTHAAGDNTTSPYQQVSIDLAKITLPELVDVGNMFNIAEWYEMNCTAGTEPWETSGAVTSNNSFRRFSLTVNTTAGTVYLKNNNTANWGGDDAHGYVNTPYCGFDITDKNAETPASRSRSGNWYKMPVPANCNRIHVHFTTTASASDVSAAVIIAPRDADGCQFGTSAHGVQTRGNVTVDRYIDLPEGAVTVDFTFRVFTKGASVTWSDITFEPQCNLSKITTADVSFELEASYLNGNDPDRFKPLAKYTYMVDGEPMVAIGEPRFHLNTYGKGTAEEYKRIALTLPDGWYVGTGVDPTTGFTQWNSLASLFGDSNVNKVALYAIIRKVGEIVGGNSAPR